MTEDQIWKFVVSFYNADETDLTKNNTDIKVFNLYYALCDFLNIEPVKY